MGEPSAEYHIFLAGEEKNVGIWYLLQKEQEQRGERNLVGQPVRLAADLVEWRVTPPIRGGGPHRLGPGPYKYTTELEGEVFATNDPAGDRRWFLIPANTNERDTYLISTNEVPESVWTAREPHQPIRIHPFEAGNNNQVFKIVPIFKPDE